MPDSGQKKQLAEIEAAIEQVSKKLCPCGHNAEQHNQPGCPCPSCDLRTFEVEQGSVYYADKQQRVTLAEHLRNPR